MKRATKNEVSGELGVNNFVPNHNYHKLLGYYVFQSRKRYWSIIASMVFLTLAASIFLTWSITSSSLITFAKPTAIEPESTNSPSSAPAIIRELSPSSLGKVAHSEAELRIEVRKDDDTVFWAGAIPGAKYTLTHQEPNQNLIRYLPGGVGLEDTNFNYRIIATYKSSTAYDAIVSAGKSSNTVVIKNENGSIIYYERARPKNVFIVFQGLDYQVEIFDPVLGVALKLARTPGLIAALF